jgi:hypothetical protein
MYGLLWVLLTLQHHSIQSTNTLPIMPICLHQYLWCNWQSCTNILMQLTLKHQYIGGTVPVAPIGEETLTSFEFFRFCRFLCLQHHYIGARWLAALIYWCIIKRIKMLAALTHSGKCCHFNQLELSGNGNTCFHDGEKVVKSPFFM